MFTDPIASRSGVYLWTVEVEGVARPWCIGQTRRGFGERMGEHVADMLSGQTSPRDPVALSHGDSTKLCEGVTKQYWPDAIPSLLREWETLADQIVAAVRMARFHVAPLDGDEHLYDRVEGAIGRYYKAHPDPDLRAFFAPGIRLPAAIPGDRPIRLDLSSEAAIAGLPVEIAEPVKES